MKKLLLLVVILFCPVAMASALASELSEDYTDIAAQYCIDGNYREALNYINKILVAEPNNREAQSLKSTLEGVVLGKLAPYSEPSAIKNINTLYDKGDYAGAILALNSYIKSNSNSDFAYALRAKAYMATAQYQNAESDIKTALALNDDLTYRFIQAKINYLRGNFRIAKQQFEGLTGDIQTSEIYKYMGLCDYMTKNYTDALLNLDRAIILSDEDKSLAAKYNEVKALIK